MYTITDSFTEEKYGQKENRKSIEIFGVKINSNDLAQIFFSPECIANMDQKEIDEFALGAREGWLPNKSYIGWYTDQKDSEINLVIGFPLRDCTLEKAKELFEENYGADEEPKIYTCENTY